MARRESQSGEDSKKLSHLFFESIPSPDSTEVMELNERRSDRQGVFSFWFLYCLPSHLPSSLPPLSRITLSAIRAALALRGNGCPSLSFASHGLV